MQPAPYQAGPSSVMSAAPYSVAQGSTGSFFRDVNSANQMWAQSGPQPQQYPTQPQYQPQPYGAAPPPLQPAVFNTAAPQQFSPTGPYGQRPIESMGLDELLSELSRLSTGASDARNSPAERDRFAASARPLIERALMLKNTAIDKLNNPAAYVNRDLLANRTMNELIDRQKQIMSSHGRDTNFETQLNALIESILIAEQTNGAFSKQQTTQYQPQPYGAPGWAPQQPQPFGANNTLSLDRVAPNGATIQPYQSQPSFGAPTVQFQQQPFGQPARGPTGTFYMDSSAPYSSPQMGQMPAVSSGTSNTWSSLASPSWGYGR